MAGYMPRWFACKAVTHPSTNRTWRWVTSLMRLMPLTLRQTVTKSVINAGARLVCSALTEVRALLGDGWHGGSTSSLPLPACYDSAIVTPPRSEVLWWAYLCLCVRERITGTICPNITKFSTHVASGCSLVLLWRHDYSGLWMTSYNNNNNNNNKAVSIMLQRFNFVLLQDTLPVDLPDLWPSDILILAFVVFNPGDLYYLGYLK